MITSLQRIYEGTPITFNISDGETMVNAAEMSKPFDKDVSEWLKLTSTENLIFALAKNGVPVKQSVQFSLDGDFNSTWLHEDLFLFFARWLSVGAVTWYKKQLQLCWLLMDDK